MKILKIDLRGQLTNKNSGKVLDLENGQTADSTNIRQWSRLGGSPQEWRICDLGNGYCKIVSMAREDMAVTVEKNDSADGLNVQLEKYTGGDNQQFKLVQDGAYYGIVSKCSDDKSCLDVFEISKEDGANICQWEFWSGDGQLWKISPVCPEAVDADYIIRNVNSGLYLGEKSGNIEQSSDSTAWSIKKNPVGDYSIFSADGKAVTIENGNEKDGNNVTLTEYTGSSAQRFTIKPDKDGSYAILSLCSESKSGLDVFEISTENGANICQWEYWGGDGQKWVLIPTSSPKQIKGDVNSDGQFNVADLVMMQKWLLGSGELTDWTAGDLCEDGIIDAFDMVMMRRLMLENR